MIFLSQFLIGASVLLQWDPNPISNNVTKYTLYERFEGGLITKLQDVPSGTQAMVQIKPAASYVFYVTASNAAGESDPSNSVIYLLRPTFKIVKSMNGPLQVITLSADVFTGMHYAIEASRDFQTWQVVNNGITTSDSLSVPFNPSEPYLFFRLKKSLPATRLLASVSDIPPISYRKPTRWERFKWFFRYKPGMHPKNRLEKRMPKADPVKPPLP